MDTPTFTLSPAWKPIVVPLGDARDSAPSLEVVDEAGVAIIAGRTAIHVIGVFDRQKLLFSIRQSSKVPWRLNGYCVHEGHIYVTAGPVLSMWRLTGPDEATAQERCVAARNLLTQQLVTNETGVITQDQYDAVSHVPPTPEFDKRQPFAFSPPMVRRHAVGAARAGILFVLQGNGSLYSLDDGLGQQSVTTFEPAASASFFIPLPIVTLSEVERPNATRVNCYIYYLTAKRTVLMIDATSHTPTARGHWQVKSGGSSPQLRGDAGLLWSLETLTEGFSAFMPAPGTPPLFALNLSADAEIFAEFEVSPQEELLAVRQQLLSYASGARTRSRWGALPFDSPLIRSTFWPDTSSDQPGPTLVFMPYYSSTAYTLNFNVYLANTVDPPYPALVPDYPPPPKALAQGTFTPGFFSSVVTADQLAMLLTRPVILRDQVFMLVRGGTESGPTGVNQDYILVCYSIADVGAAARALVAAEVQRFEALSRGCSVRVLLAGVPARFSYLVVDGVDGAFRLYDGVVHLPGSYAGRRAWIQDRTDAACTLRDDAENVISYQPD